MAERGKLSMILFADIAGYTALMQTDEHKGMDWLKHFNAVLEMVVSTFVDAIAEYLGDACLLPFPGQKHLWYGGH